MYDVIVMFQSPLSKGDYRVVQDLTGAKVMKRISKQLSEADYFFRIILGVEESEEPAAYELIQCDTLTALFLSPLRPSLCVRGGIKVLDKILLLGHEIELAQDILIPLMYVEKQATQAQKIRKYLYLPSDDTTIDLIKNQIFPSFKKDVDDLIAYSRAFYAKQAHTEP